MQTQDRNSGAETGTIIGNKVYFVQYENSPSRYDKDLPTAQKIIDSFKIENHINVINKKNLKHKAQTTLIISNCTNIIFMFSKQKIFIK